MRFKKNKLRWDHVGEAERIVREFGGEIFSTGLARLAFVWIHLVLHWRRGPGVAEVPCVARHPGGAGADSSQRIKMGIGDPVAAIPVLDRDIDAGRDRGCAGKGRDSARWILPVASHLERDEGSRDVMLFRKCEIMIYDL